MARYRAEYGTYLHERTPVGSAPEEVRVRSLRDWIGAAFLDEPTFKERLQSEGIEAETFGSLISGVPFTTDASGIEWADELDAVLATAAVSSGHRAVEVCGEVVERVPFDGLLCRFLRHFAGRLDTEMAGRAAGVELTTEATNSLTSGLAERLVAVSHRALVRALAEERSASRLRGADPAARYYDYDSRVLGDPDYLERFFTRYPLLGRMMIECGRRWLRSSSELVAHLDEDLADLRTAGLATGSRVVERITSGMGDPHNGGRTVAEICFDDGSSLVYKPRSVEPEALYADAAALVGRLTPRVQLRPMRTLPKAGHGWCEFVGSDDCRDLDEVNQYYRNLGAALAVLYMLGAIDMHMGNVLAVGPFPVPVDLETILQHTEVRDRKSPSANEKALDLLACSVLATGILPIRMFGNGVDAGIDVSAVGGGGAAQKSARPLPTLAAPFTDEMRIEAHYREIHGGYNRPRLDGEVVDPASFKTTLVAGFCDAYDAIAQNAGQFDKILERAAAVRVRHLVRNTRRYDLFRYERYHPDYLQDGADTDRLLDKLWTAAVTRKDLLPVVPSERRALLADDIPSFTTTAGSLALSADDRTASADFFAEPSVDTVRRRLAEFCLEHRDTQVAVLEDSLGLLAHPTIARPRSGPETVTDRRVSGEEIRSAIRHTLDDLADRALLGDQDCTWIAVGVDGVRDETLTVRPLTTTLYDGLAGMSLVYGYAAALFDDEWYAEVSRRSIAPVVTELEALAQQGTIGGCIGAYAGTAGSVYALHHLASLKQSGSARYVELVGDALSALPDHVDQERSPDVVAGLAGCAAVAAGMVEDYGDVAIQVVRRCADRLARTAVRVGNTAGWSFRKDSPLMGGFAHGTAGISWALLTAGRVLGDADMTDLGLRAMAYDDSLRIPDEDAWQDLRDFTDRTGINQTRPTLWCHGSTGIGLSRLLADSLLDRPQYEAGARAAVRATCAGSPLKSQGLCHGDSGSVEFLGLAARLLTGGSEAAGAMADSLTASIVAAITTEGFDFGPISGPNVPGLMMGRSGVALALMRRLHPGNAPGVLWLEPPSGDDQGQTR